MENIQDILELLSPRRLQQFLRVNDLSAKKGYGQNFLIKQDVLERIVRAGEIQAGESVLEVGPGLGFLSHFLLQEGAQVHAFEKDKTLFSFLQNMFGASGSFHLHEGDFLKADLDSFENADTPFKVVSNLPYNITSPVFGRLLEMENLSTMVVTVQKQVAERIVAQHATKQYGAFTLFCKFYADPELLFHVSPGNFHPAPAVYSSVVRLKRHKAPLEGVEREIFFKLVKSVFSSRRKTLLNSLRSSPFANWGEEGIYKALESKDVSPGIRGEKLSLEEFVELARAFAILEQG